MIALVREARDELAVDLASLWTAVSRAGGAVRFRPDTPSSDIRTSSLELMAQVADEVSEMFAARDRDGLIGAVFLRRRTGPNVDHVGEVFLLMVHPDRQSAGLGTALLDAAVDRGRERGLAHLLLSARGGTPLPAFYARRGWTQVGLFPGVLKVGPGDLRDEHWFQLRL